MSEHEPGRPKEQPTLLHALLQRHLFQWGFGYVAGAWILLELIDFLADLFGWPIVFVRLALTLFAFGFPAVLILAWYHGEKGRQEVSRREAVLLVLVALGGTATAGWVAFAWEAEDPVGFFPTAVARVLPDDPRDAPTSLAVLPFVNLGGDPSDDPFADGVTEDIIAQVSRISHLRVISRTSIMQYRGTLKSVPEIGRELNVDFVLEGSVRRVGEAVRIVAQLIDARTDEHVWSDTFDPEITDILRVQADVAEQVADALASTLAPAEPLTLARAPVGRVDSETYEMLTRGRRLIRSDDPGEWAEGQRLLAATVERNPSLRAAVEALADALVESVETSPAPEAPSPDPRIRALVEQEMGNAWQVALVGGDPHAAEAAMLEALRENPNDARARRWYGVLLARGGEEEEALEQLRIARSLDPFSPPLGVDLAEVLTLLGRHEEAVRELERVLDSNPEHHPARIALGLALHGAGRTDEALEDLRRTVDATLGHPAALGALGYVLALTGDREATESVLDSLLSVQEPGTTHALAVAQLYAVLGDTVQALQWLERVPGGADPRLLTPRQGRLVTWHRPAAQPR
jgi:TolB-like protein/tetratricopeptide (TPR) repeat protein